MYFGCDHWSIRKIPICFTGFVCFVKNSFPFLVTGVSVMCKLLCAFEALFVTSEARDLESSSSFRPHHPGPFTSVYCLTSWICFFIREASSPVKWGTAVTLHSLEVWLLRWEGAGVKALCKRPPVFEMLNLKWSVIVLAVRWWGYVCFHLHGWMWLA